MAPITNGDDDFIRDLMLPYFYTKTKHFLKFYLTNGVRMAAHQNTELNQFWYKFTDGAKTVDEINSVCHHMYDMMEFTGEKNMIVDVLFNDKIRSLFGNMFGMHRDFWAELGIDDDKAYEMYWSENIPDFQRFQILMCWELFWGVYGEDNLRRMSNYTSMYDDLYATISMSEFTPYYLTAIKCCVEESPHLFVFTIVNIFMHAFKFIKDARRKKYIEKKHMTDIPVWQKWYCEKHTQEPTYFNKNAVDVMKCAYDQQEMMSLLPACVKVEL